jgi:hypothetical protein
MLRALTVLGGSLLFTASVTLPTPAEVLIDRVDDQPAVQEELSLDFDAYAAWAPEFVDHLAPTSEVAAAMVGAYRVWETRDGSVVLGDLTLWPTEEGAARYVDQVARDAAARGLDAQSSPFDGALRFGGDADDGATVHYVTWRHGTYGAAFVSIDATSADLVIEAATAQEASLDAATESAGVSSDDGGGGLTAIIVVVLALVVAGAAVWLFVKVRRTRRSGGTAADGDRDGPTDTDDIIPDARAQGGFATDGGRDGPTDEPVDTDDIIAEARRRARAEVESARWEPTDDDRPDDG